MKKIQNIARICAFCALLASVSVAFNACASTSAGVSSNARAKKVIVVKKAPTHAHLHKHGRFWWR